MFSVVGGSCKISPRPALFQTKREKLTGYTVGGFIMVFICSQLHHEKWQLVFFMIAQTALIGSMASIGVDDRVQAIVTVIIAAATITPPQLVSFTMLSLALDDQQDM
jgi:hypothetical protein